MRFAFHRLQHHVATLAAELASSAASPSFGAGKWILKQILWSRQASFPPRPSSVASASVKIHSLAVLEAFETGSAKQKPRFRESSSVVAQHPAMSNSTAPSLKESMMFWPDENRPALHEKKDV